MATSQPADGIRAARRTTTWATRPHSAPSALPSLPRVPDTTPPSVAITAPVTGATNGVSLSAQRQRCGLRGGPGRVPVLRWGELQLRPSGTAIRHPRHDRALWGSDVEQSTGFWPVHPHRPGHRQRGQHHRLDTHQRPWPTTPPRRVRRCWPSARRRRTRRFSGSTLYYNPTADLLRTRSRCRRAPAMPSRGWPSWCSSGVMAPRTRPRPIPPTTAGSGGGASASGAQTVTATNGAGPPPQSHCHPTAQGRRVAITAPAAGATASRTGRRSPRRRLTRSPGSPRLSSGTALGPSGLHRDGDSGTPDTTAPYGVTWSSQPAPGPAPHRPGHRSARQHHPLDTCHRRQCQHVLQ